MNVELSVVILCYRAGKQAYSFVEETIGLLKRSVPSWELILVGNYVPGADDDTPAVVKDIASKNKNVIAITLAKQGMMGWDVRSGLDKATGSFLCFIDGDNQMPAGDIVKVYEKIKSEKLDLVKTFRKKRFDSLTRVFVSFIYNIIFKLMFPSSKVRDVNSKPKIFTREAYKKMGLMSDDWFIDAEIVIKAGRFGFKVGEVATDFHKCEYRRSFVKTGTVFEFLRNMCRAKFKGQF